MRQDHLFDTSRMNEDDFYLDEFMETPEEAEHRKLCERRGRELKRALEKAIPQKTATPLYDMIFKHGF